MGKLPTREEMFLGASGELQVAYKALGDASDWLRSDWRPLGSRLVAVQVEAKSTVFAQIDAAKRAINLAQDAIDRALGRG